MELTARENTIPRLGLWFRDFSASGYWSYLCRLPKGQNQFLWRKTEECFVLASVSSSICLQNARTLRNIGSSGTVVLLLPWNGRHVQYIDRVTVPSVDIQSFLSKLMPAVLWWIHESSSVPKKHLANLYFSMSESPQNRDWVPDLQFVDWDRFQIS